MGGTTFTYLTNQGKKTEAIGHLAHRKTTQLIGVRLGRRVVWGGSWTAMSTGKLALGAVEPDVRGEASERRREGIDTTGKKQFPWAAIRLAHFQPQLAI